MIFRFIKLVFGDSSTFERPLISQKVKCISLNDNMIIHI